jgi:cobalt-precorrin-5B (C1)-methyltransferase
MKLRSGFTTGAAAAAATRAALGFLLDGRVPEQVSVVLPCGDRLEIAVHSCRRVGAVTAVASVIKDAGDDPDITHGAEISALVTYHSSGSERRVEIRGGPGVGTVTKPGLETPPGQAAITAGPHGMITQAAVDCMAAHAVYGQVTAEIFVPRGVELARHTLNGRLGIVGGISILGTSGIVRPLSHEAYVATIGAALSVARAAGLAQAVLTTGRRSERLAQRRFPAWPVEAFVQIGDYFGETMALAVERGFEGVVLAVFFGKAVKMAQGIAHTHARSAALTLAALGRWVLASGGDPALAGEVVAANTARQAFERIKTECPVAIQKVGREMVRAATVFGKRKVAVRAVIFGFDGEVCFDG